MDPKPSTADPFKCLRMDEMVQKPVFTKISRLLTLFSVFFTPLLFFIQTHDQFELPKLVFLGLLAVPALAFTVPQEGDFSFTPLSLALLFLFLAQTASSLPATSLSWRTSLLGDYENFSGLSTLALYLVWFRVFSLYFRRERTERPFFFQSLAALLSALYAIGQHFGFDFIRWNPESVNITREFAALGNPNFLSAYLALSLPLFLCIFLKPSEAPAPSARPPGPLPWFLAVLGFVFLVLGTDKAVSSLHLEPSSSFSFAVRVLGLLLFTASLIRLCRIPSWAVGVGGSVILLLGLFCTGSRGGFLGALLGLVVWGLLAFRNPGFSGGLRQTLQRLPKATAGLAGAAAAVLLLAVGHGFLARLADSILHMGQSLAVSRLHIWGPALKMARANPFLGVGLDNFKIAFPYYSGIEFNKIDGLFVSSRMAHNELLQMLCTTGLLGLSAYLGVLGTFAYMGWKIYRHCGPGVKWSLAAIFSAAVAYHVQNFFSFGVAGINLPWFMFLGAVQGLWRRTFPPAASPSPGKRFYRFALVPTAVLLSIFLVWFSTSRFGADLAFGQASAISQMLKKPDPQMPTQELLEYSDLQIGLMKRAVSLFPGELKYRLYLGLSFEQRAGLDAGRAEDWELKALDCYRQTVRMSPANGYYYNDEGRVEDSLARYDPAYGDKAVESYQKSVQWDPASPFFILNWAQALQREGKDPEAEEKVKQAFALDPDSASHILTQIGLQKFAASDKEGAFRLLGEAIQGNTSNAEAYYCRGVLYLTDAQDQEGNHAPARERAEEKKKALADLEKVKSLDPAPEKYPNIRNLDVFIAQAKNESTGYSRQSAGKN